MRKPLIIAAVAGAAAVVTIGAISLRTSSDSSLDPVSARPAPAVVDDDSVRMARPPRLDEETLLAPERPENTDEVRARPEGDRRGEGRGDRRRRPSLDGKPMNAEDWSSRFEEMNKRRKDFMDRFDTDGDGELSEAEREVMREEMRARREEMMLERMTERFDADGDGVLNEEERLNAEAELEARRMEREVRMIERFDSDGDGVLSDAENQAAREQFNRGRGGDRGPGGGWQEAIQKYDADGDGELNLDESYTAYLDQFDQRTRREFVRRYDGNTDGAIDAGDLNTFLEKYRAKDESTDVNGDGVINERDVERFRDLMVVTSP